jgi:hypothetical protein
MRKRRRGSIDMHVITTINVVKHVVIVVLPMMVLPMYHSMPLLQLCAAARYGSDGIANSPSMVGRSPREKRRRACR